MTLHAADLLHKDFHSRNIVFFFPSSAGSTISLRSPYLVNFQYSRSYYGASGVILKQGDIGRYRHPSYQGFENESGPPDPGAQPREYFRPEFDVYGLGVTLLEIAGWEPLDAILGPQAMSPDEVLAKLRQKAKQLSFRVGRVYRTVVEGCLMGEYATDVTGGQGSRERLEGLNKALFWNIYRPLRSCSA